MGRFSHLERLAADLDDTQMLPEIRESLFGKNENRRVSLQRIPFAPSALTPLSPVHSSIRRERVVVIVVASPPYLCAFEGLCFPTSRREPRNEKHRQAPAVTVTLPPALRLHRPSCCLPGCSDVARLHYGRLALSIARPCRPLQSLQLLNSVFRLCCRR